MAGFARRHRLAIVFGGRSTEHEISCVSARGVLAAVDRERYEVVPVGITPEGRWLVLPDDPSALATADGRQLPTVRPDAGQDVILPPDPNGAALVPLGPQRASRTDVRTSPAGEADRAEAPGPAGTPAAVEPAVPGAAGIGDLDVDVVFPLLHGPYGEDGTIQGLFEMAGLPYVGSGVFASAAAMDKQHMKTLLAAAGLPVGPYAVLRAGESLSEAEKERLGLPVFVKPARGGSSIGISRVDAWADLDTAVKTARVSDPKVLVEAAIIGREIECGVLDALDGGQPETSVPAEIVVDSSAGFYDFEAKYSSSATRLDVPADLPAGTADRVRAAAAAAFRALDCAGLARVDVFLTPAGEVILNEVNTMPGFTPTSLFPRMWAAAGLDYPALVDRLIQLALRRGSGLR
ncbi:D-alanine--D-alanine ligase [Frankia sp. CNm7]|uniref:D-alanine--D-alanine ligase n=1 Tax=Frankia nepalensis TaxID=1836974 RepID=A0A937RCB1_9ACTN|nr:D-alanine--D-alanine ligase family protein [Frankia nepalensis]MBL7497003.1 D-alanine--D-alanine ligase [Frankia nepalensis]MBL7510529.1 D-alanine--D-alanine ligase [Frankia nepalensis]MBL7520974.1 D-alanine--D-alanine ligase [Frankia nepalensis]MBL7629496.1 D-alanine--D-alanine ligase [Frankia nepalensis]